MSIGNRFILSGVVYALLGMSLGIVMGASHDFTLAPVHAHTNLLGWVSMVLFGLVYRSNSAMAAENLAKLQFWIFNLALITMMITLSMVVKGNESVVTILAISEFAAVIGMLIFGWLVWKHRNG